MVHELHSPLAKHLINRLRSTETEAAEFRRIVGQLTLLLADAAFGTAPLRATPLRTWQGERTFGTLPEAETVFVTILRAGLPMLDAATALFPGSPAGFLAMKRDETTHEATLYYDRVPDCEGRRVVLLDPMVATGGSLADAAALLYERKPASLVSLNVIAAPEGLEAVTARHPELELYVAQIDERLNGDKYIIPGLGDAGDRAFNTL